MALFEELDYAQTDLGELILRRRATTRGVEVFEVKLDGQFLMSSLVNASEVALADLALAPRAQWSTASSAAADPESGPADWARRAPGRRERSSQASDPR